MAYKLTRRELPAVPYEEVPMFDRDPWQPVSLADDEDGDEEEDGEDDDE
jgi:hypothetical protein